MELTRRQKEILRHIEDYIDKYQYPPSIRDIASHFSLASAAGVHKHLMNLKDKGYISLKKNTSRSIRVLDKLNRDVEPPNQGASASGMLALPLEGKLAAGLPIQSNSDNESIPYPESMVRYPEKTYALRVQGDSMIEEGICDGDYLIVEHRESADNGEMVIAMINLTEATIKKFYAEGKNIRLQAANFKKDPIIVSPKEVSIYGVVVGVLRNYR